MNKLLDVLGIGEDFVVLVGQLVDFAESARNKGRLRMISKSSSAPPS
jgi:hypothetical protein